MVRTDNVDCDIAVLGGGMGGVAAALAAARAGHRVCLTEETPWLGGQCTSQGVSALDEHEHIETFGGTALYYELRNRIRSFYTERYELSAAAAATPYFNPGAGWVSRLCFEPRAALAAILEMVVPHVEAGLLQIFYGARLESATLGTGHIHSVTVVQPGHGRRICIHGSYYLDATELGDLLPLVAAPYVTGAEDRVTTGEPDARAEGPAPDLAQTFTYPFVVDCRPGTDNTIPAPPGYARMRDEQPFTLTLTYGDRDLTYKVFEPVPELPGAFWTYRRILASDQFAPGQVPGDLAMINWAGNDYRGGDLTDVDDATRAAVEQDAKNLALGLLHWLQTEVPRDDGRGTGYPELRLRPDVLGTADGLSMFPYVRESRRIRARRTVVEQDVLARLQPGPRAAPFTDSVGLGWYPMDIHGRPGDVAATGPTRPFQIPLGALIAADVPNLLPACKNIGVTHMTNGCYRLHPVEWNIGEAAGSLASHCLHQGCTPGAVLDAPKRLRAFQTELLGSGVPLFWYIDLPPQHPAAAAAQLLAVAGLWPAAGDDLTFGPEQILSSEAVEAITSSAGAPADVAGTTTVTRADLAVALAAHCLRGAS